MPPQNDHWFHPGHPTENVLAPPLAVWDVTLQNTTQTALIDHLYLLNYAVLLNPRKLHITAMRPANLNLDTSFTVKLGLNTAACKYFLILYLLCYLSATWP